MPESTTHFVGMDVHKDTIDVAIATNRLNGKVRHYGQIHNRIDAIDNLAARLKREAGTRQERCQVLQSRICGIARPDTVFALVHVVPIRKVLYILYIHNDTNA